MNNISYIDSPFPFSIRRSSIGIVLIKDLAEYVWILTRKDGEYLTAEDYDWILNKKPSLFDLLSRFVVSPSVIRF